MLASPQMSCVTMQDVDDPGPALPKRPPYLGALDSRRSCLQRLEARTDRINGFNSGRAARQVGALSVLMMPGSAQSFGRVSSLPWNRFGGAVFWGRRSMLLAFLGARNVHGNMIVYHVARRNMEIIPDGAPSPDGHPIAHGSEEISLKKEYPQEQRRWNVISNGISSAYSPSLDDKLQLAARTEPTLT